MIFFRDQYAKIWEIETDDKGRVKLRMSTSEKDRQDDKKWRNSNWNAVAVGTAKTQIQDGIISAEDRVKIKTGKVTNELYTSKKDGEKKSWLEVTIFEFDTEDDSVNNSGNASAKSNKKSATKKTTTKKNDMEDFNDVISDADLPF